MNLAGARISGLAIAEGIAGFTLLWSGLKNQSIASVLKEGLSGNVAGLEATGAATTTGTPVIGVNEAPAATGPLGTTTAGEPAGSASGQAIAADALRYTGAGYVWAGAPAKGPGNWDCSSFTSWVLGHDLGLAIPGYAPGRYTGSSHGPTTLSYLGWTGAATIGHSGAVAAPGDLCVWQTHMGIALGPSQMISAQNPANGTAISKIDGFMPGEVLYVRRIK